MRFGSVCSGIEAASVAWEPLGWRAAWFSEIEPFPCAVLAHHYPDTLNHGDMTTLPARILAGEVEAPDLLCGGTPCQAFSVAGLRRSLDDARGNLSLTFCEIANAIDAVRLAGGKPAGIVFWENVPGVLSTRDNAFGCFLGALAGCDTAIVPSGRWTDAGVVVGPQRTVAWRVLDAQYFGLAQRRRRVFVVASAQEGFDPAAVLLEWEGVRRDFAPSREAGKGVARGAATGAGSGVDFQNVVNTGDLCGTLMGEAQKKAGQAGHGVLASTYCIKGAAIGRKPEAGPQHGEVLEEACYTLNCVDQHAVAMCLNAKGGAGRLDAESETLIPTNGGVFDAHAFDARQSDVIQYGDKTGPLDTDGHTVGVLAPTLTASNDPSRSPQSSEITAQVAAVVQATAVAALFIQDDTTPKVNEERAGCLRRDAGGEGACVMTPAMQVRRLTPVECERLQGFPDHYTAIPWRGKPASECPDGPRYKALGNSWAVPCVRWIGNRIESHTKQ